MKRLYHFRAASGRLGPLEQRLLEAIWRRGNATVRELVDDDYDHLAYTTVMTTLNRLFKKNLLTRAPERRAFRYTARYTREQLRGEVAAEAFRELLEVSPVASIALSDFVEILAERDARLLDELRLLLKKSSSGRRRKKSRKR